MTGSRRYSLIDAIRALAVINMILYHLCYDIFCVFEVWPGFCSFLPAVIWEHLICCSFILVSGISLNFTRHGCRRGVILNLCGFLITAVTVLLMPDQAIWFGILNFLGCAAVVAFILREELSRIKPLVGMAVFFILFMLCYGIPQGYIGLFSYRLFPLPQAWYQFRQLAFLGFAPAGFVSADYFPMLPWIFLYLFGFTLWRMISQKGWDRFFVRRIPVLDGIGRHSLVIYLAHQPVLYGICRIIFS